MIHTEENEGFNIVEFISFLFDAFGIVVTALFIAWFALGINPLKEDPTTKPHATQIQDKCPSNTLEPIKLTGSIGSVKTDSIKTDKLNFPMWCPLIEDKPRNWGTKK